MRPLRIEPLQVSADVRARRAHAVTGLETYAFVLYAALRTLDEDIASPCATPIHRELAAAVEHGLGELLGRELPALVGVDDLGHTKARKGPLDNLLGMARNAQNEASTRRANVSPNIKPETGVKNTHFRP
jgi:hypothetical protein